MQHRSNGLQLWGGMECTVNRVQDHWFDQLERCGHLDRCGDLDFIRDIGIQKLRYGFHWERSHFAGSLDIFDQPLADMQRAGIEPIAGLVHHGSGPPGTSLLDPDFAEKLAAFALALARRHPGIGSYTPVNEPQTTARFSGLYGHWYPHHRSFRSYVRALVNQLRASVLCMRAVRSVRSDAEFIHTEDGGKTFSTPALADICEEREHRRWLGLDLLCGRVDEQHPLYPYLRAHGLSQAEILWFQENACPPDVIGLNYYLTSDRFLDHRLDLYWPAAAGGDTGTEPLVDIEAVRVRQAGIAGAGNILTEAWDRYGIPVAITEAHLGGPEDQQACWLLEVWNQALAARAAGVDCVAVTAWALFGSFDWPSLVTCEDGLYEPGVFSVAGGSPVPTALAGVVSRLARGESIPPQEGGWWERPDRLIFGFDDTVDSLPQLPDTSPVYAGQ